MVSRPLPWYRVEWLLWLAVGALLRSLLASWQGWHLVWAGTEAKLTVGDTLRVLAGLITLGRTIAKKEEAHAPYD